MIRNFDRPPSASQERREKNGYFEVAELLATHFDDSVFTLSDIREAGITKELTRSTISAMIKEGFLVPDGAGFAVSGPTYERITKRDSAGNDGEDT